MTDRLAAAKLWVDALTERSDERLAELANVLADDVQSVSPTGRAEGKEQVLASFGPSPLAGLFGQATWSEPAAAGDQVSLTCTFPPPAPLGGLTVDLGFDAGDRIVRVDTVMIPAPPPAATAIALTDVIRQAIDGALANGTPVVVAYVDGEGQPHLSLRGSVQVYSSDQLAMWIRNPQGGILAALPGNPHLALFYRDPASRTSYQFHGRGWVDSSEAARQTVFDNTPEVERNFDPQRKGVAVIVDLDRVEGRNAAGPLVMERGA